MIEEKREHRVNVPLLRKTLEHITAHPEEWQQRSLAVQTPCGTAYCVAGHVAKDLGDLDWAPAVYPNGKAIAFTMADGRRISDVAVDALGLSRDEAWGIDHPDGSYSLGLFCVDNTLADLWRIASELTDGEIEVPTDLPGDSS